MPELLAVFAVVALFGGALAIAAAMLDGFLAALLDALGW